MLIASLDDAGCRGGVRYELLLVIVRIDQCFSSGADSVILGSEWLVHRSLQANILRGAGVRLRGACLVAKQIPLIRYSGEDSSMVTLFRAGGDGVVSYSFNIVKYLIGNSLSTATIDWKAGIARPEFEIAEDPVAEGSGFYYHPRQ